MAKPQVALEVTAITWHDLKEMVAIKEALEAEGYTFDGRGIKEFLNDALFGDEEEEVTSTSPGSELGKLLAQEALKLAAQNPQLGANLGKAFKYGAQTVFRKFTGK